jgi:Protein of unknown function (DUF2510)
VTDDAAASPGWYAYPRPQYWDGVRWTELRYWDGVGWTEQVHVPPSESMPAVGASVPISCASAGCAASETATGPHPANPDPPAPARARRSTEQRVSVVRREVAKVAVAAALITAVVVALAALGGSTPHKLKEPLLSGFTTWQRQLGVFMQLDCSQDLAHVPVTVDYHGTHLGTGRFSAAVPAPGLPGGGCSTLARVTAHIPSGDRYGFYSRLHGPAPVATPVTVTIGNFDPVQVTMIGGTTWVDLNYATVTFDPETLGFISHQQVPNP